MKGDIIQTEFRTAEDPDTGVEVTRLSDDQGDTNPPYFTVSQVDREMPVIIVRYNRTDSDEF